MPAPASCRAGQVGVPRGSGHRHALVYWHQASDPKESCPSRVPAPQILSCCLGIWGLCTVTFRAQWPQTPIAFQGHRGIWIPALRLLYIVPTPNHRQTPSHQGWLQARESCLWSPSFRPSPCALPTEPRAVVGVRCGGYSLQRGQKGADRWPVPLPAAGGPGRLGGPHLPAAGDLREAPQPEHAGEREIAGERVASKRETAGRRGRWRVRRLHNRQARVCHPVRRGVKARGAEVHVACLEAPWLCPSRQTQARPPGPRGPSHSTAEPACVSVRMGQMMLSKKRHQILAAQESRGDFWLTEHVHHRRAGDRMVTRRERLGICPDCD